jgi:hypothetical protein
MNIDKEKVSEWIESHWTAPRNCTVCQSDDWIVLEKVWELREFQGGPVLPVIALMCNVCGHTIFFNAIAVRAVSREGQNE